MTRKLGQVINRRRYTFFEQ